MAATKKLMLIPYWIEDALKRNRMSLAECRDFNKIKPVCAVNDLLEFATLQNKAEMVFGKDAWYQSSYDLIATWGSSIAENNTEMYDYLTKNIMSLCHDASFDKELTSRLFTRESRQERYAQPFSVVDLTRDVAGVVIYPGFFCNPVDTRLQLQLIEAVLKVLYVYDSHSEVSKTSLFLRYLDLLSKNG